jgi:hypothetical protein
MAISSLMVTTYDEAAVIRYLRLNASSAAKFLPLARREVNNRAASCGGSAIVVTRAQVALSLLDEGERILSALGRRL